MAVLKIKPTHKSQGDYVVIDDSAFDPKKHKLFDAPQKKKVAKKKAKK